MNNKKYLGTTPSFIRRSNYSKRISTKILSDITRNEDLIDLTSKKSEPYFAKNKSSAKKYVNTPSPIATVLRSKLTEQKI